VRRSSASFKAKKTPKWVLPTFADGTPTMEAMHSLSLTGGSTPRYNEDATKAAAGLDWLGGLLILRRREGARGGHARRGGVGGVLGDMQQQQPTRSSESPGEARMRRQQGPGQLISYYGICTN
jgi:hypothetical protein